MLAKVTYKLTFGTELFLEYILRDTISDRLFFLTIHPVSLLLATEQLALEAAHKLKNSQLH
jgi:hypothetical protein